MAALFRDPSIDNYDIIAIREPWRNPFNATTHRPAKDRFHLCYPSSEEKGPARVSLLINKKLDDSRWQSRDTSRGLCTVTIVIDDDAETSLALHNEVSCKSIVLPASSRILTPEGSESARSTKITVVYSIKAHITAEPNEAAKVF
ncbi:zinc knuckle [Colletotrichum limetticola]|uniref:Zinc knuckle n=1 Tax=Colletotrichum limetticola TaxID=1209924 RepID=A0ABQ9P788_9PEZI|nr:zinc knuckle [Colletotrichum limetticola]